MTKNNDWYMKGSPARVEESCFYGAETTKVYLIETEKGSLEHKALQIAAPKYEFLWSEWVTQTSCVVRPEVLKNWHIAKRVLRKMGAQ